MTPTVVTLQFIVNVEKVIFFLAIRGHVSLEGLALCVLCECRHASVMASNVEVRGQHYEVASLLTGFSGFQEYNPCHQACTAGTFT